MCTGRVDPTMIAEAFTNDADGVMVVGCHFGDCHYITGNVQGKIKVELAARVLTSVGLSPKRVTFDQCSSAEGERFVKLVTDFNQGIRELGPLGTGDGLELPELREKITIAKTVLAKEKLRWVVGKFTVFATEGNKYGEVFTEHEMWRTLDTIVMDEVATHESLRQLGQEACAVKDLAARLKLPPPHVLRYVLALQRRGLVDLDGVDGNSPRYKVVEPRADAA
jgi:F420-non-reducing hydrogenase iron-sulfur subunit